MSFLFVYGTLLRPLGHPKHTYLAQYCHYICPGRFQGKMFDIGDYPGVIPSIQREDSVQGEVYAIKDEALLLSKLDEYEGCSGHSPQPHEYQREIHLIELPNGTSQSAWIYLYTHDIALLKPILTGDYLEYCTHRPQ
ncbi:MAG: gamma-glutamylcyclotransferase [Sedimenticola sp.]|nr:gamma-glutamylcyclotransferase [Sedimenticola sp.]